MNKTILIITVLLLALLPGVANGIPIAQNRQASVG